MKAIINGEYVGSNQYILVTKGGKKIPVIINSQTIYKGEKAVGIRGSFIDITKVQQANEIIQKTKNELELTVKKRNFELKLTTEKLERILEETIKALSSAVEIRDPYTAGHQRKYPASLSINMMNRTRYC